MKLRLTQFDRICLSLSMLGLVFSTASFADIDPTTVVGAWLFEEGKGNTIIDASGAGNDGTIQGAPGWVNGKFGQALDFDGKQDHVIIPDADSLDLDEMTVAAWINLRNYADDARIITKEEGVNNPWSIYSLQISGAGDTKLEFRPTVGGARRRVESNTDVPLNEWVHVAATFNGTDVVVYLNGEADKTEPHPGEMLTNDKDLWFGASEFWAPRFFDGLMDEAVLLNVALSPEEIQQSLMERGLAAALSVSPAGKATTTWAQIRALGH